eukprot:12413544-Karenia_brevis.AAC.1
MDLFVGPVNMHHSMDNEQPIKNRPTNITIQAIEPLSPEPIFEDPEWRNKQTHELPWVWPEEYGGDFDP